LVLYFDPQHAAILLKSHDPSPCRKTPDFQQASIVIYSPFPLHLPSFLFDFPMTTKYPYTTRLILFIFAFQHGCKPSPYHPHLSHPPPRSQPQDTPPPPPYSATGTASPSTSRPTTSQMPPEQQAQQIQYNTLPDRTGPNYDFNYEYDPEIDPTTRSGKVFIALIMLAVGLIGWAWMRGGPDGSVGEG
jgi:hypothetical protein